MIKLVNRSASVSRKRLKESGGYKSREELARSITSWAFGNPNMSDIDDNLAYLADRFFANNRAKGDMIYACEEPEELIAVLSNCSEDVLRNIEIGLCIDDESIYGELDYINSLSEEAKLNVKDAQTKVESVGDSDYIIDRSAYSEIKSVVKKFFSGDRDKYKVGNWVVQKGGYDLVATLEYYESYGTYSICGIFDGSGGYELRDYHNSEFDFPFFSPTDPIKAALDELNIKSYITESKTKCTSNIVCEEDAEIEVKNPGILEVPDGKNVNDLPMSHFEKLAKKKGLSKITKALNNLQVWNKNDDPELSKWAGNMVDKLNKKFKKDESFGLSESYLDYDWRNTYTTKELKEMSAEKLLDLKWYDADFTKAELVAVTDDYNNATRRPLEEFFVGADNRIHTDKWYPVQTKDGLELFMRMNGRSSSIEVVAGMKKIKYGARVINRVVRAGKVTFDSFWTKDDFFKWILDVNFAQD